MKSTAIEPASDILSYLSFTVLWIVNLYLAKLAKCVIKFNKKISGGGKRESMTDKEGGT